MPSVSSAEDGATSDTNGLAPGPTSTSSGSASPSSRSTPKPAELTPVEEPEPRDSHSNSSLNNSLSSNSNASSSLNRSPKRQSSTVYEKVCAKLSRSLTSSTSSPSLKSKAQGAKTPEKKAAPLATEDDEDDLINSPKVKLRSNPNHTRRCQSEVTPAKTAELLAKFVASRTAAEVIASGKKAAAAADKKAISEKKEVVKKKHMPLPKATEDKTQVFIVLHFCQDASRMM